MTTTRAKHNGAVWGPILSLMVLAPFLAEVSSGAMTVTDFVMPQIFFPFTIMVYGLPVLLLREAAVRWGLGVPGMWALGMVYGIVNEGLFTETLFYPLKHYHEIYADYGVVGNLLVPWMFFILPWHGLFSVCLPVLLVDSLFPRRAGMPWLPRVPAVVLGIVVCGLILGRFVFVGEDRLAQSPAVFWAHLAVLLAVVVGCVLLGLRLRRPVRLSDAVTSPGRLWRAFGFGVAVYLGVLLVPDLFVESGLAWQLPVAYTVAAIALVLWSVRRIGRTARAVALAFVLGAVAAQVTVILVLASGVFGGDMQRLVVGVLGLAAIGWGMVRLGRKAKRVERLDPA